VTHWLRTTGLDCEDMDSCIGQPEFFSYINDPQNVAAKVVDLPYVGRILLEKCTSFTSVTIFSVIIFLALSFLCSSIFYRGVCFKSTMISDGQALFLVNLFCR
jgi:hypothetical protein